MMKANSNAAGIEIEDSSGACLSEFSKTILWAWDRPEDLSFIEPKKTSVAFLAMTILIKGSEVISRTRVQPFSVPEETRLMAVVHIESSRSKLLKLSDEEISRMVSSIAAVGNIKRISAVQIDFDAKRTERPFYRNLLQGIRQQLPHNVALSMTALASWCIYDNWLGELPIDEAVPMLFRMGADEGKIISHLQSGKDFSSPVCRQSIGIATDETPDLKLEPERRLYIFHTKSWSSSDVVNILTKVRKGR